MEFKELIAEFAAKYGIKELEGADDMAELYVEGVRVELLNDSRTHSLLAYAEIGHPPPDADDKFGAMMLEANERLAPALRMAGERFEACGERLDIRR